VTWEQDNGFVLVDKLCQSICGWGRQGALGLVFMKVDTEDQWGACWKPPCAWTLSRALGNWKMPRIANKALVF
jgi:hypothetical protein